MVRLSLCNLNVLNTIINRSKYLWAVCMSRRQNNTSHCFLSFLKKKKKAGAPIFPGFSPYRSVYFEVKDRQEFPTCTYFWFCCWFVFILLVCFYTGFCVNYFATIMPTYAIIAMKWELCQLCVCTTLLRVDQ